jgi:pimeloyl-ACP methyl ester carboxylesterase
VATSIRFDRDGVALHALDYGGDGPTLLLLHGLAGHAGEWSETAAGLTKTCRVIALDARGHGGSERAPADVSRAAHVADVALAVERLGLGPVVLAGQSLGAHTALLVAARHPGDVRALVVAEASPAAAPEERVDELRAALAHVPPAERRWDDAVMIRTLREAVIGRSYWGDWEAIRCPTLVVRADRSLIPAAEAREMARRQPHARLVELAGAGHDLHLDRPAEWSALLAGFVADLTRGPAGR